MQVYNPYNPKNRLFTQTDIQSILSKHNCDFKIKKNELYQRAMVHSSYVKRTEYTSPTGEEAQLAEKPRECLGLFDESYERLEHLGDSILGTCVSTYLMKRFPEENEGFMTDLKKEIVCNEMLGTLSQKIGLDRFYIISRHNEDVCSGRTNSKKLGDILEAFIGALWTDSDNDFKILYSFVICLVETYIDIPRILMNNRNFKEQLQKLYQSKFHHTPTYTVLSASTNQYSMAAVDERGVHLGIGTAFTKKQAEQLAAKDAISRLTGNVANK
jgi:ribonuclease-3